MAKTLFEQYWGQTEEEFAAEEKELRQNELKRSFESDYDKASDNIIRLKKSQKEMFKDKFKCFNLNSYRQSIADIEDYQKAKDDIAKIHLDFFGCEIARK